MPRHAFWHLPDAEPQFDTLSVRGASAELLLRTLPPLVNVNLPQQPTGVAWTRVSVRQLRLGRAGKGSDRSGALLVHGQTADPQTRAPIGGPEHDLVSIPPPRLDLTDEDLLKVATKTGSAAAPEVDANSWLGGSGRSADRKI
jgi:hypothetical protein